jgi:hypothetical protein
VKPGEERLELVTDFASLRAGMLVVLKPCPVPMCSVRVHRGMLVAQSSEIVGVSLTRGGLGYASSAWSIAPTWHSHEEAITPAAVAWRILFRVVDGLDPAADAATDRVTKVAAQVRACRVGAPL